MTIPNSFHRFAQPSYAGAPSLPVGGAPVVYNGANYSFVNVIDKGAGGSSGGFQSAYADAQKTSGVNIGTYFAAFAEDATSNFFNRGFRALSENTDFIDNLLNRPMALPSCTANVVSPVAPVTSVVLPPLTYVGSTGGYPLDRLFKVVDLNDREIIIPSTGLRVKVVASDVAVGSGFSAGVVTLTITPAIPTGQSYRVYYATRSNLAMCPDDVFSYLSIQGSPNVDGHVEDIFRQMQGPTGAGILWDDAPTSTLYDLSYKGLNEVFRRSTFRDVVYPTDFPRAIALDTPGAGAWFARNTVYAPGMTGFSDLAETHKIGDVGDSEYNLGALWSAVLQDTFAVQPSPAATRFNQRVAIASGVVVMGNRMTTMDDPAPGTPALFDFYVGARRKSSTNVNMYTVLRPSDTFHVTGATITLDGATSYFTVAGPLSGFAVGVDIIKASIGGHIAYFTLTAIASSSSATLSYLDGAVPAFAPGTLGTILEWISTTDFIADGSSSYRDALLSTYVNINLKGLFHSALPTQGAGTAINGQAHAHFFAGGIAVGDFDMALAWGGYDQGNTFRYVPKGYLYGDGSVFADYVVRGSSLWSHCTIIENTDPLVLTPDPVDVSAHPVINWHLDANNPTGASASAVHMSFENIQTASAGKILVAIRRLYASRINSVVFTASGYACIIDPIDAQLTPPDGVNIELHDVYEGVITADHAIYWSVRRYVYLPPTP